MPIVKEIRGLKRPSGGPGRAGWLPPEATVPQAAETMIDLQILEEDGFFLVSDSSHVHFSGGDIWQPSEWKSPANT